MLKQIDKMQSIMTEKVLGTSIEQDIESKTFSVLFGLEVKQNKMAENLERGWSYYKGIIASIPFNTVEEAQDYANKIMNTNFDYNDYKKHKDVKNCGNCKHTNDSYDNDMTDYICDNLKSSKHNYGVNKTNYCDSWED